MRGKLSTAILAIVVLLLGVGLCRGADLGDRVKQQRDRIQQGIRSGELTRAEAEVLLDNLERIERHYYRMKADGRLTKEEQERLDWMLDRNSRMIYDKKHNAVSRLDVEEEREARAEINQRIRNQRDRIQQGIRSGELTDDEAEVLLDNLERIERRYSRMKADGRLTKEEQERLDWMLDYNSRMIREKRDNPVRHLYFGEHESHFRERIQQQQERINQGIRSGELTRAEAEVLLDNLERIERHYYRMKADGRLTEEEKERLDRMLDRNSRMIYDKKHNPVRRLDWDKIVIPVPLLPPLPPLPFPAR